MSIFHFESDFMRQQEPNMEVSHEFLLDKQFIILLSRYRNKEERHF